jgi:hypothetical protein
MHDPRFRKTAHACRAPYQATHRRRIPSAQQATRGKPLGLVLPPELVEEIDAIAAKEKRSRVRMIEYILEDRQRSHRHGRAAEPDDAMVHVLGQTPWPISEAA